MKRVSLKEYGGSMSVDEVEAIPEPTPKGVVVKTEFCGICHSDVRWLEQDREYDPTETRSPMSPLVVGHEISGEVYKLGANVETDLKVGDKVLVYPWMGCVQDDCDDCNNDRVQCCQSSTQNILGWSKPGGFQSFVSVADSKYAVKAPSSIPLAVGGLLTCSGLTTFTAVSKVLPHLEGKTGTQYVLVIGAGGLGLFCVQFARLMLPKNTRIICADVEKSKLDAALERGADDVIWWDRSKTPNETPEKDDDFVRQVKEKTNGGPHAILDIVNSPSTVSRCLKAVRVSGVIVLVGFFGGHLKVHLRNLMRIDPTIYGVLVGPFSTFLKLLDFVKEHPEFKFPPMAYYKPEEAQTAVTLLVERKIVGRGVIKFDQ